MKSKNLLIISKLLIFALIAFFLTSGLLPPLLSHNHSDSIVDDNAILHNCDGNCAVCALRKAYEELVVGEVGKALSVQALSLSLGALLTAVYLSTAEIKTPVQQKVKLSD